MKKKYFILFYVVFSFSVFGQEISDLKNELSNELADTTRISLNLKIDKLYQAKHNDSSIYYNDKALKLAVKIDYQPQIAQSLFQLGKFYDRKSNYELAIKNYIESSIIFKKLELTGKVATVYIDIASCYSQLYVDDDAIDYYLKSLEIHESNDDQKGISLVYLRFGSFFFDKENFILSKKYYQDALDIYIKLDDKIGIAASYTNLGNAIAEIGDNEEGLEYYKKSIEILEKLGDQHGIAINYNNIGDSYMQLDLYSKATDYFLKSLKIAEILNDKWLSYILLMNISEVKLKEVKYKSAIRYAQRSLKIGLEIGKLKFEAKNMMNISKAYKGLGNISEAFNYNQKYINIKDSLIKIENLNNIKLFEALRALAKTQNTINNLSEKSQLTELRLKNEKKITYILIFAIVVFGIFVIFTILQQASKKKAYSLLEYKNYLINNMKDEMQVQRDDLDSLNETKDKIFSIIAHDLKNPFNSIIGFTDLMIENNYKYDEEKRLKFLKIIKESSSKASTLLDNLLLWANSQSGNLKFNPQKINLVQQISDVISLLEIQAINKEIKIENLSDVNLIIDADENMLSTVLRNLISNAIKFTEAKGKIQITSISKPKFVEITVKDSGVGISKSQIENLFCIESKSSNRGTESEQGSGLGLSLCKDFVERHGGKIWVESSLNKGSEFKFTLPIASKNHH